MRYVQVLCSVTASQLTSARFCQQSCEIPRPSLHTVFTGILLDHNSLPPDFASRFVKSLFHFRQILPAELWNPQPLFSHGIYRHFARSQLTSARFCQQTCEIPSPCFHTVFTCILLDQSSLPPGFASRVVKSLALVFTRYLQHFLDHSSIPPDFATRVVKSLALVFTLYLQAFSLITAHFRQILPADLWNP